MRWHRHLKKGRHWGGKKIPQTKVCGILEIFSLALAVENLEDKSTFVILKGAKISENDEENLSKSLEEEFSDISAEFLDGGQKIYDYIVGIV